MQVITWLDILAIILSIVSLIISVVAFFASLKFYTDGVKLQEKANDALTKIEEKTGFIQTQVGGMFDRTLDAALGKREAVAANFEEITVQLEQMKQKIVEEGVKELGSAGEQERNRLAQIVDRQLTAVQQKVEETRESADELVEFGRLSQLASLILRELYMGPPTGISLSNLAVTGTATMIEVIHNLDWLMSRGYVKQLGFNFTLTKRGHKYVKIILTDRLLEEK